MKQLVTVAAIMSVIACNQTTTETKGTKANTINAAPDSIQLVINAALDYHTNAINKYDLHACGELFTDDASVIEYGPAVKRLSGRKEIDSSTAQELEYFKQMKGTFDMKWETHSLRVNDSMAYQDATVSYTMNTPDSTPVKASADAYMAWKKTGAAQWKVHSFVVYPR